MKNLILKVEGLHVTPLDEIPKKLKKSPSLDFHQHWLSKREPHFCPGSIVLGSDSQYLVGHVILTDHFIKNSAKQRGDRTWEMGDVFEIFIKRADQKKYWEFHITPENFHLSLALPPAEERPDLSIDEFESRVEISPHKNLWQINWRIPWSIFDIKNPSSVLWQMSFCRYDYSENPNDRPVLSSTSPLTKPNFHRIQEWLEFEVE